MVIDRDLEPRTTERHAANYEDSVESSPDESDGRGEVIRPHQQDDAPGPHRSRDYRRDIRSTIDNARTWVHLKARRVKCAIYNRLKREMDPVGTPRGSIPSLLSLYNLPSFPFIPFIIVGLLVHFLFDIPRVLDSFFPFLFIGTLSPDNIDENQWVLISRVSSKSQLGNTSTGTQLENLKKEVEEMGGEIVKEFERAESAANMDRESLNEVLRMAEDGRYRILGLWKLDRLTRADPWESIEYITAQGCWDNPLLISSRLL